MNIKSYLNKKTIIFLILGILVGYWFGQHQTQKKISNISSTNNQEWELVNEVSPTSKPPTSKPLFLDDGSISFNETSVFLTNNEDKDWTSCTFTLFPEGISSKEIYKYDTLTLVEAKGKIKVPLRDFTLDDGKRFNNNISKPDSLRADCYRDGKEHSGFFTEGVNYKDLQKYYDK